MKYSWRVAAAFATVAGFCSAAQAQFADNCGSAPTVAEGVYSFDLAGATNDFAGPCGLTATAPDRWVRYVPTGNGTATVSTCGLSGGDTVLTVLNGECGAAVLRCSDDDCGFTLQSSASFPVAAGNVYMVRIAGYDGSRPSGQVSISRPNDHCSDATNVGPGVYGFDNTAADTDGSASCSFGGQPTNNDLWYRYSTPGPGVLTVSTCDNTNFDTVLSAYAGCGGAQLACNDDSCGTRSSISFNMAAGSAAIIRVAGWNGASGAGQLRFSFDSADSCGHAADVGNGTFPFNNTTAIDDGPDTCSGYYDVWFRYHAGAYGWMDATTCGLTAMDTVLGVFQDCGGVSLACNDDTCGVQSAVSVPVTPGATPVVRVSGWAGDRGSGSVRFSFRSNDNCADATPVADGDYGFDTTTATTDGPTICGQSGNNVWFSYHAPALGRLNVTTCGLANFDTVLTAFDGCGGPALACNDDAFCGPQGLQSAISFPVQPNSDSRISLGGYQGIRGSGQVRFEFVPCRIDFNGDGFVDFFDYDDYVNCFETGVCPPGKTADFNGDQFVDFFDYDDFVANFEAGC